MAALREAGNASPCYEKNLTNRILQGGIALGSARLLYRGLDIIRTLTIARWLGPEEMGVYAVASLAISALEYLSQTGFRHAIIQRPGDVSAYLLPARTIQALRGLLLGVLVFLSAPWMASFFQSPKSVDILRTMAILPVLVGLEPPAVTLWQRELHFNPLIALQTVAAAISLVVGLGIAYFYPNAWALVGASLSSLIVMTAGAHLLSNRAEIGFTWKWKPIRDIFRFGFWIFLTGIVSYLFTSGGDWVIGRLLDVRSLALYQMAFLIGTVATAEMGQVVAQLSFPVFSRLQNDRDRLRTAFRNSFGLVSLTTIGMAGMVCTCAPDGFRLVLGAQWLAALPLVPWLTVWGVCSMFASCIAGLFQALGKPDLWMRTVFGMVAMLALAIYPLTAWLGALGVAILMAGIGVIMQGVRYWLIGRMLDLKMTRVISHVAVPAVACTAAVWGTGELRQVLEIPGGLSGLIFSAVCLPVLYALLLLAGQKWMEPRPSELLHRIMQLFQSFKKSKPFRMGQL